ncbi:MAG TPA: DUF4249 domain-containing protein [Lentimicrobium sp.]|nr:DUF4249 domain-containing protein [Lentimicrobium sp.]
MHRNRIGLMLLMLITTMISCIKPYDPEIRSNDERKLVVNGQVTDGDGFQKINITWSSPIESPGYIPVLGCTVTIKDDKGHEFSLSEMGNGDYTTWIDPSLLGAGSKFMLEIFTPDGDKIVSDFDQISACPQVDSVYYEVQQIEGSIPGKYTLGIQFFLDLAGTVTNSRNYRWEVFETWEYHADYPLEWYYDGTVHHVSPPDYSRMVCWRTLQIPNIFTLSTEKLVVNAYKRFPLHFVTNRTSRLMYGYSLLVAQYALSEEAYIYWDQLRINGFEQGGLYEKQPLAIQGNLHNLTHPDKSVLGFFSASSVRTKRIFIQQVPGLPLDFFNGCSPAVMRKGLVEITPRDYPGYLMGDETGYRLVWLNEECVNCLSLGGINIKPDFWPND